MTTIPTVTELGQAYTETASAARALTEAQADVVRLRSALQERERSVEAAEQRLASARAVVRNLEARGMAS